MNVYAEKVKQYLEEEQIPYSCEKMGETDENFLIYAIIKDTPNIWAEVEDCGKIQLTSYLLNDMSKEKEEYLQNRTYALQAKEIEFQIFLDDEGTVTALYNAKLKQTDVKETFAKAIYVFCFLVNQCIRDMFANI